MNNDKAFQIIGEYSRRSFYGFVKTFWSQIETNSYVDNWHIKVVCDALQERFVTYRNESENKESGIKKDLLFNLPPGSTKSMLVSVFFPAWVWLRMPSTKIICSSYSFKIAEELASKCLKLIQSDLYQAVIKFKLTKLSLENIKNSKGGQRFVTSTGGTITGVHADIIINDDPNSPQAIYSVAARTEAKRFVTEILPSRKTNIKKSYTITVQQRLHNDDISGCLLNLKQPINHICIPAIDKDNKSFFSERFPIDFLLQMKEQLGSVSFNAQYLQRTQEATGGIIKKIWIREDFIEEGKPFYFIDSAYGGKNADDNAVLGCYKKDNYLYLYSLELNKFEFPELIHWLQNNLPPTAKVYIEGKASGKSIIQTLKQQTRFNIVEIQPKGSKLERKHAVSPFFEGGRVVINKNIKHKQTLIEQLIFDETRNDDALDVVMHAIEQLLKVNKGVYNIR